MSVDWHLLPANPLAFFGLKDGFERKELKRAYGRLIKQFKPETHPAEFQRIREAYEVLESQNRYGVKQIQLSQLTASWNLQPTEAAETTSATKPTSSTDAAIRDPRSAYKWLAGKKDRTPQDFFILATLADLVDRDTKQMYLRWLLTGVKQFPRDPGLLKLVTEYLAGFTDTKLAESTLVTLAKIVRGDDFFPVSERLWIRLIQEVPFAEFAKVLQACEANLKHVTMRSRLVFYVRILRFAMWKAPIKWLNQRLAFVKKNGLDLPDDLEEEFEFIELLRQYTELDRKNLEASPVRLAIDRMLQSYCTRSFLEAATSVSSLCDELARNGHGVMEVFPSEADESTSRILLLCSIVAGDIGQQTGLDYEEVRVDQVEMQATRAASDLQDTIQDVVGQLSRMRWRVYGLPFLGLWLGPIIVASVFSFGFLFGIGWTFIAMLLQFLVVKPMWLDSKVETHTQTICQLAYEDQWRPRVFRYVQSCHVPLIEAMKQLQIAGQVMGQGEIIDTILSYAIGDQPLHFFAQLQMFQH